MMWKNNFVALSDLLGSHLPCIAATVIESYGSTPQKPGSTAIIGKDGIITGTVGGGTVERSVLQSSNEALQNKKSSYCFFSLANDISDTEGSICGGGMKVLIDAQPEKYADVFAAIKKTLADYHPGVLITTMHTDKSGETTISRFWTNMEKMEGLAPNLQPEVCNLAKKLLHNPASDKFEILVLPGLTEEESTHIFLQTITPLPRLIIAGAGHIGKALSKLGRFLDFEVTVWDSRKEFATKENLPDADIILDGNVENTFNSFSIGKNTYFVLVTTGHRQDMEVLKNIIDSGAGYIGMIGSRKKVILIREKFLEEGWATKEQWNKLYTPIGIDIQSETVEEIAISIAAELVLVRHQLNRKNE